MAERAEAERGNTTKAEKRGGRIGQRSVARRAVDENAERGGTRRVVDEYQSTAMAMARTRAHARGGCRRRWRKTNVRKGQADEGAEGGADEEVGVAENPCG